MAESGTNEEARLERRHLSAAAKTWIPPPTASLNRLGERRMLRNKVDKLQANVKHMLDYKNACVISLTDTWFKDYHSNQEIVLARVTFYLIIFLRCVLFICFLPFLSYIA